MTKNEFISVLQNKTLNELGDWCWKHYETAQKRLEVIERLKKQKASETVRNKCKELREENNKLKARLNRISTLTSTENVAVADPVDADQ